MLQVIGVDEARICLLEHARPIGRVEWVPAASATGRVLAEPLIAKTNVPAFDRSTVDGLAVRASDTFGASESMPAMLELVGAVAMGQAPSFQVHAGACAAVPTGGALPDGADAMVMIEYVEDLGDSLRLIHRPISPGDNLIRCGDDFKAGQPLIPAGHQISTADIGTLAALDIEQVLVCAKPRVALISTGDELVQSGQPLKPGQVHDINAPALAALVQESGGEPVLFGIVADHPALLDDCLKRALAECDLVLVSGGSSVGEKDYLRAAIEAQGDPGILFHGLAVKPGKPTLAGAANGRIMLGLPGHPLAAWFLTKLLAAPLIYALQGAAAPVPVTVTAKTNCRIPSNAGRESIIPVKLLIEDISPLTYRAEPVFAKSGLISVLSQSDGFVRIEREREGLEAGMSVTVYRIR